MSGIPTSRLVLVFLGARPSRALVAASRRNNLRILRVREPETVSPARGTRALLGKIRVNHVTRGPLVKKEMPDRASLAIRHLVDVSNQTKTELCVTVVSLSFEALSRSKVFTAYPTDDQVIQPKGLAVDLCLRAIRNSKVESRKLRGLNF